MTTDRAVVVGAGRMGVGIAVAYAVAGQPVTLLDLKHRDDPAATLVAARSTFNEQIALLAELELVAPHQCHDVTMHAVGKEADRALSSASVVVEAVPERLEAKREAFLRICAAAPASSLLTSTTSTFLADDVAAFVTHPQRFVNTHWLNPAYLMPLVEVSPSASTSPDTVARARNVLEALGKVPVTVAASPGYIVPRLQALVMNEAARMVEEGVASAEDLDTATRLGLGLRFAVLGVLEFIDWGGVDILLYASRYLEQELEAPRFSPPDVVTDRVASGATGMVAGRGLRSWTPTEAEAVRARRTRELVSLLRHLDLMPSRAG